MPEALSFARELRPVMMGGLLIIVTIFLPGGVIGLLRHALTRLSSRQGGRLAVLR